MAKPILLTPLAKTDLEIIADWLIENWGLKVLDNFLTLYEAKINIISAYPTRYPLIHTSSQLRKAVLTKHNNVLYREMEDHIDYQHI